MCIRDSICIVSISIILKKEKITNKVLKVVERIARNEVEKTVLGRTAECSAIYHQPKRPKKREN